MQQPLEMFTRPRVLIGVLFVLLIVTVLSYFGATTNCIWLRDFSANLAAGTLVAIVVGVLLTMYVQLSRQTAEQQARQAEAHGLLRDELQENLERLEDLREAWAHKKLLLSIFQTGRGKAVLEEGLISGEDIGLISQIFNTYEALNFFNHVYKNLLEDPIRHGKLDLSRYQHNLLNDPMVKKFDELEALIRKTLDVMPEKGK